MEIFAIAFLCTQVLRHSGTQELKKNHNRHNRKGLKAIGSDGKQLSSPLHGMEIFAIAFLCTQVLRHSGTQALRNSKKTTIDTIGHNRKGLKAIGSDGKQLSSLLHGMEIFAIASLCIQVLRHSGTQALRNSKKTTIETIGHNRKGLKAIGSDGKQLSSPLHGMEIFAIAFLCTQVLRHSGTQELQKNHNRHNRKGLKAIGSNWKRLEAMVFTFAWNGNLRNSFLMHSGTQELRNSGTQELKKNHNRHNRKGLKAIGSNWKRLEAIGSNCLHLCMEWKSSQ
ncbi:hypothetical protein [Roseimarinus sediminis]|uniref:hypothetical protein n=1 Tax=Roseimarinus sediminis TaxID=1610899 RepID=UPI003D1BAEFE